MGQTLSEPVTAKETSSCGNSTYKVGSSCMQGWRINMEDAHTHLLSVPEDKDCSFFAVYDGHGGAKVAQYAGNHLHKKIVQSEDFIKGDIEKSIKLGFLNLDKEMVEETELKDEMAGTTAIIVIIKKGRLYCGNVGDSRSILSRNGLAEPLSYDHKPSNEEESRRIVAAGGWVEFNRVNGNLALSRALGDFVFKRNDEKSAEEQIVTAFPDVIEKELEPDMEFIVLACDGIWDVLSNQEVCDFCRDRLAAKAEPEAICEELLTRCLAPDCQMGGLGCDNMTAILVCLLQGQTWEEFCHKCARPRLPTPPMDDGDCSPPLIATPQAPSFCAEDEDGAGDPCSPPDTTQTNLTSASSAHRDGNPEGDDVSLPYSALSDDSDDSPTLGVRVEVDNRTTVADVGDSGGGGGMNGGGKTLNNNPPNKMSKMDRKKSSKDATPDVTGTGGIEVDEDELPPVDFQCDPKSPPPSVAATAGSLPGVEGTPPAVAAKEGSPNNNNSASATPDGSSSPKKTTTVTRH